VNELVRKKESADILAKRGKLTAPRQNTADETTNGTGDDISNNHTYFLDSPGALDTVLDGDTAINANNATNDRKRS
jgi:hypothetical protein